MIVGFTNASSESSRISFERVAESNMVCLFSTSDCSLRILRIWTIESLKPISRSLSASSKMRVSIFPSSIDFEFMIMSISLPGVAITISGLFNNKYSYCFKEEPPITTAWVTGGFVYFDNCSNIDAHWAANSHEGCMINTHVDHAVFEETLAACKSFQICFSKIGNR